MLADNTAALAGLLTASIVVPLVILGLVVWLFVRSARRFDAEQERAGAQPQEPGSAGHHGSA